MSRFALLAALLLLSAPYGTTQVGSGPLAPLADPASGTLPIAAGDTWRYLKGTAAPPANWNTVAFDHSAWLTGPGGFGYGDGDDATVLGDMQNGYVSVYIRRLFDVANPGSISGLTFTVDYDDGFVAYLNGTEVARRNVSGTPPSYNATATASHEASAGSGGNPATTINLDAYVNLLVAGPNVLAIQGHNVSLTSTDFSLIPSLQATNPPPTAPAGPDSPADGSSGASSAPDLCVTVNDPNAESMSVTFKGRESTPSGEDFTIIVLPDAQYYSMTYPDVENAQMQWIVANRAARNIVYVSAVGDSTNDNNSAQWGNVSTAFAFLEDPVTTGLPAGIPYGIALGNHDQTPVGTARTGSDEGATTTLYNQTFGKSRFCPSGNCRGYFGENYTFGGSFAANMDNYYQLFNADGMEFIAFHLEWDQADNATRQNVLAWMRDVLLNVYPNRRAMITTHYLINPGDASWSNQGAAVYEAVKDVPNVFAMFCGHLDQANMRTDTYLGHTIYTMVSDYQSRPNGGNGWLRILTFSPADNSIHVQTYSPYLDQFINNHADNTAGTAKNDFTLAYTMSGGSPFETIGTVAPVSDGGQACVSWPGRQGGQQYEWFVEISDGTSTTTSSRWTFTPDCTSGADCNDNNACTTDACDAGVCTHTAISGCGCNVNADCDNGNACDGVETCSISSGTCVLGTAPSCNDDNPCTTDSCVPATGCVYTNNTLPCSDGNTCTSPDACSGGACVGAYLPVNGCCADNTQCNDGNPATLDRCTSGTCSNTPSASCQTNADCADGDACTAETCSMSTNTANTAALSFNGSNQYVTFGTAAELGLSQFTLETWFKRTGTGVSNTTGSGGIANMVPLVAKGAAEADGSNVDANYVLGINTTGNVLAADFEDMATGLNHPVSGTTPIANNVWYHAAATYDGTTWRLYLNGGLEATLVVGAFSPRSDSIQPAGLATMQKSSLSPGQLGFFAGVMDEVRIWNFARSQADIASDRFRPLTSGTGLIARWGLEEGAGTTIADSVGPPNSSGTLTNAPTWVTDHADLGPWFCAYVTTNCSDGNPCTVDVCDGGSCSHPIDDDGTACDDGNACTSGDACVSGVCQGGTPNSAPCDDGDACTTEDACSNGTCTGGTLICCTTNAQCNDGQACTNDACTSHNDAGLIFDGVNDYVTFAPDTELGLSQFTIETWFKRTGAGVSNTTGSGGIVDMVPLVAKGAPEADGSNVDANYVLGISTASNVLAADFEDVATGLNHPVSGTTPIVNGTWYHAAASYDGTTWRLYLNGNLEATLVVGAFTPRADSIQPGGLGTMQRSAGYSGTKQLGFFAGLMDEVRIWNVARSQPDIFNDRFQELTSGTGLVARWGLNEGTGTSIADSVGPTITTGALTNGPTWELLPANLPQALGTTCGHTANPACCTTDAQCDDGNVCTADSCVAGECSHASTNQGGACDDGNACTQTDTCSNGACVGSTPIVCNDSQECTDDSCNPANGACVYTNDNTNTCSDGNACTQTDACVNGACVGANPIACSDNNACTDDSCNPSNGSCVYTNDDTNACTDGNACTQADACVAGVCLGSNPIVCNDGNACTDDNCNPANGSCVYTNDNTNVCADTNACTGDACVNGACQSWYAPTAGCCGSVANCDDGNATTTDTCVGAPNGSCSNVVTGACTTAAQCNDSNGCTTDACVGAVPGRGLQFDGVDDNVTMGTAPGLGSTVFTVETWFKRTGAGISNTTGTGGILNMVPLVAKGAPQGDGSNIDANYVLGINTVGNVLAVDFEDTATGLNHPLSGTTPIVNGTWYHAAATYDGTTWRIYLNGNLDATLVVGAFTPRFDSIQHAGLGSMLTSAGATLGFFNGVLDEVRIWNVARTQAQIQAQMNQEVTSGTGLVGRWGLNETTGTTASDSATAPAVENGTLRNGTTTGNGPSWVNDSPFVTTAGTCTNTAIPSCSPCLQDYQCNDGSSCTTDYCNTTNDAALQFDGVDDYVTMGAAAGTSELGAATFTVETWFYWTGGGVGQTTGTGGIALLIPLVAKGSGEGETPANVNENYILGITGGKLAADFEDTAGGLNHPVCTASAGPTITTNAWHHAAATYDGTSWKLYLDGAALPIDTACSSCTGLACTVSPGATPEFTSIQHFGLGGMLNSTGARGVGAFQGRLDEVRVWNVARSLEQIQADRFREVGSAPNLIGRWSLSDGATTPSTTTAVDSSGRGNNGTLTNGPAWSGGPAFTGSDSCAHTDLASGTSCSDGDLCTLTDACNASGQCIGSPKDCDDHDACTNDSCSDGACVNAASCGVGGTVYYYRTSASGGSEPSTKPVPNVDIDRTQDAVPDVTTGSSGTYAFGSLFGNVTLAALPKNGIPRAADHNDAISSFDASRAATAAVGNGSLSVNQVLAGDVTGNGTISSLDASYIARFSAQLVDHFPVATTRGSDWKFLKCDAYPGGCGDPVYAFAPLTGSQAALDFYAILYGDVTGDWQPAARTMTSGAATSPEEREAVIRDREFAERFRREGAPPVVARRPGMGAAELSLAGWKPLRAGERRQLAVDLSNADGILGLDLVLEYDPSRIAIVGVQAAGIGSGLSVVRADQNGSQRIAAYGYAALSGSGSILTITVEGLNNRGRQLPPTIDGVANEGTVPLRVQQRSGGSQGAR